MKPSSNLRKLFAVVAAGAMITGLAACGTSSTPQGDAKGGNESASNSSISVALRTPTWILPISVPGKTQGENGIFRGMQWVPLFDFTMEANAKYNIDEARSFAKIPELSEDGKTFTVTLKDGLKWNDGTAITTRDIEFWFNLIKFNKEEWASYRKGQFPDNVASFEVVDEKTFKLTTTEVFSPGFYAGNQLAAVTPLPHHAWAKTADDAAVSDDDRTEAGAKAIFAYLKKASEDPASWGTNKLWQTVSGPWVLSSYTPSGETKLVANEAYTGEDKPKVKEIVFKPFTSDDAEFNALRSGGIDYGYIPAGSISERGYVESQGYKVSPWYGWSITYMPFNFANPKSGPIFKQKYIRQAMQQLIDQETISKVIWQEMAAPTCGPVPQRPGKAGSLEGCAYGFAPEKAKELLEAHGWKVTPDGVTTCEKPGTGADQCGEGIAAGAELSFTLISQSGFTATSKMMAELKSQFSKVGIALDIKEVPDSVAVSQKCKPETECNWDLSFFGSQASWYFPVYASGHRLFATDAPVNLGSYSDAKADELIQKTLVSSDDNAMQEYNDYLAEDLPVLWMPNPVAQVSAYKADIDGIDPQEPTLGMYPQDWSRK